ncbi:uncharacterized protein LOC122093995 [Macadamia integrifolia]|uniref:uncharacterized protein LOC122093995 n=1 Tax=Macadamia integrifolia TaxID=60698 RepID=UPI001C52ABA3|nr:uncharacterized protein LOC122093995 [Macadamia integrifolia]
MEGVGARLGRSSTRYGGPTTVFSGPVRKWKKKWIHVSPSNTANHHSSQSNGTNGSHLLLYKWTPLSQSNNTNGDKTTAKDDDAAAVPEEPPPRKFRYVPIAVLEEQKNIEAAEKADEEGEPSETDPSAGAESKSDGSNGKPDINDVPMEEAQASDKDQSAPQELSETNLDLSLGLKAHDGDPKRDQSKDDQPERVN